MDDPDVSRQCSLVPSPSSVVPLSRTILSIVGAFPSLIHVLFDDTPRTTIHHVQNIGTSSAQACNEKRFREYRSY